MESKYHLPNNPTIRVEGKVEDKDVIWEGTARFVEIDSEHDFESINSWRSDSVFGLAQSAVTTTLKAELQEGWTITMKDKPTYKILKTASTTATDRTVAAVEAARAAVGAPDDAKFRMGTFMTGPIGQELVLEDLSAPNPIQVEFRWEESV